MKPDLIIARYGEVGLKSNRVRRRFENRLINNIKASIDAEVKVYQARIFIFPKDFDDAIEKLERIFGIVSYSPAVSTKSTFEDVERDLATYAEKLHDEGLLDENTRFAISCRRVGTHEFSSQEMAAFAGAVIVKKYSSPVDLTNPELTIYLEVRDNDAYIFHEKIEGPGGLPLGTQGKVISLVSSGIDSPVATYLMMKRGCQVIALYCDNQPYTTPDALKNYEDLIDQLNLYASGAPIKKRVVKYGDYLSTCKSEAPDKMTCVLCKSGMYKIAGMLAKKLHAEAVIDGSSLGQVASQTLPNILATREDLDVPVLSPLIGLDKVEITRIAEKIGTFEISKRDDGGCKAVPKYPETKADLELVKEIKEAINQEEQLKKAFETIEH
ncbi:MAG: tRNA 4-thiouridine(8) synthase ThiI [Methanobrevibacter ruminantium]|uniref:tRNA uracil 4-sulfurtransferase ThiI n=1 Tax=Methanobrevibacter ruminantium TaxID=83816 RepID=UPI0026F0045F|nr:tRNA uracil 4-sulfurtransferase ThiI [Methanobrevibacter ruminantium]MCI5737776.1 tRNA 4-thiouridine(8) synthase ThiI [Methanobrevibacter ruminantium]MDD6048222.1 tRNA 4-thiouridine(8) synthase ThiI [Methanobrevibacter ruminantium]